MIPAPVKPVVTHDALEAPDIRVGTIVRVEDVPKSDKLVRDIGAADGERPCLAVPERAVPNGVRAG